MLLYLDRAIAQSMEARFVFGVMLCIRQQIEGRQGEIGKNTDPNITGDRDWVSTTGLLILGCLEKHFAVPSTRSRPKNRQGYRRIACELRRDRSDVIYTLTLYIL